ncbi:MAG: hypothetical protein BGO30_06030 [Bacteroidetes bacterium 41-46]|nr:MAG: hypothetical protein BGO30_06030 [Bacteroidetes bacterium 41-46]
MKRLSKSDLKIVGRIKVGSKSPEIPQVSSFRSDKKYMEILQQAQGSYDAFLDLRLRSARNKRFYRGNQWGDIIVVNGEKMTEEEYLLRQGKPALKQNLIRPPVRNIIGQYRSSPFKSVVYARNKEDQTASEMMTVALEGVYTANDGKKRDARQLETFLIKSAAIYSTSYSFDSERMRPIPKFRAVPLNRFFCDPNMEDVNGDDIKIIGEAVDMSLLELLSTYAKSIKDEEDLRKIYASVRSYISSTAFDEKKLESLSLLIPQSIDLCRVIKVCIKEGNWRLKVHDYADGTYELFPIEDKALIEAEIVARQTLSKENGIEVPMIEYEEAFIEEWKYYHLTPTGHCLWESDNPYMHNSHPYVFEFYPMLDGAVWSMVEDMIDQQKMVNRMVILQDFIISASAKGVLLVPEEAIPDDMTIEDFAEEWVKYNGVIKIKTKKGVQLPKQIVANSTNLGINDMINLQIKFMQDITGVHSAIQGKQASAGTPASLYAQETANASLNILDYLETFASFCKRRDYKIIQLIKQFYKDKHYQLNGGRNVSEDAKWYDPDLIRNIQFDNEISKGTDTPAYRMVVDDMLWQMLNGRFISIEMFLEHSSFPFSDKLLSSIKSQQEQLAQGGPGAMNPEMINELQGQVPQSSPQNMALMQRLYTGSKQPINQ